jgi:DNA-binding response OmpR family regulator
LRILLIEDDHKAARLLARGLGEEGFVVDIAHTAEDGNELVSSNEHQLIILDRLLPGKDGLTWCHELRERGISTPVLMLTARDGLNDRVTGLNAGADDYLTKPFAFEELLARARALLRRSGLTRPPALRLADLTLDPVTHHVTRADRVLDLTRKEYAILEILMRHRGEVVSRERLATHIWRADLYGIDNLIDVHVSNLRRKVDSSDLRPLIHTVRGRGYCAAEKD